jgi:hypothetical protein
MLIPGIDEWSWAAGRAAGIFIPCMDEWSIGAMADALPRDVDFSAGAFCFTEPSFPVIFFVGFWVSPGITIPGIEEWSIGCAAAVRAMGMRPSRRSPFMWPLLEEGEH